MKYLIALSGKSNVGKTTSIVAFYSWLKANYTLTHFPKISRRVKEVFTIIKIEDIIIGIASPGDAEHIVEKQLGKFYEHECDIIICACRSQGGTLELIHESKNQGYNLTIIPVPDKSNETRELLKAKFLEVLEKLGK